jgi:toxin-antitoxin system PIN domain toxin
MHNALANIRPDIDLLDVNVWLALVDENHIHHGRARRYWDEESAEQIAFTCVTMLGFVRLLTNRAAMNNLPFTATEAWQAYRAFRELPEVTWIGELDDDAHAADTLLDGWLGTANFSTLQWTDAHLASIATTFGCRLVSFDGGYRKFQLLGFLHLTA